MTPKLPRRPSMPSLSAGKVPQPIENVYRDLRDKRLLPVVAVLAVALVAVPIVVGGGGSEPAPSGAGAAGPSAEPSVDAPEADAVVAADAPRIRRYEKRLEGFQRRNPFRQQLTGPSRKEQAELEAAAAESAAAGTGAESGSGGGGAVSSTAPASEPAAPADDGGDAQAPNAPSSGGEADPGGGSPAPAPAEQEQEPTESLIHFSYEIDAQVGPLGATELRKGVKQGRLLPGKRRPIALFLEGHAGDGLASFWISPDATSVAGEGECLPSPSDCDYLMLSEGEGHRFSYGGEVYRMKLRQVHLIEKELDREQLSATELESLYRSQSLYGSVIETMRRSAAKGSGAGQ